MMIEMPEFFPLYEFFWLLLGLLAVWPLLLFSHRLNRQSQVKLLGRSLVVAATIYVLFALVWGDKVWLWIELMGVLVYLLFYVLAQKYGLIWLALGWLVHPVWDIVLHLYGPGQAVVPPWYAWACVSFDWAVVVYIVKQCQPLKND